MHRPLFFAGAALAFALAGSAYAQTTTPTPNPATPQPSEQNNPPADQPLAPGAGAGEEGAGPDAAVATASSPQEFAAMAASSNMFEIESSRVALEKSQQEAVRGFAQQMIDDHSRAGEQMMQAAQTDGVSDVPQNLNQQHQQMLTELQNATAEEFDALYIEMQRTAHQQAVALFSNYAEQDGALADFAETTLPTLELHLAHVQQLSQQ